MSGRVKKGAKGNRKKNVDTTAMVGGNHVRLGMIVPNSITVPLRLLYATNSILQSSSTAYVSAPIRLNDVYRPLYSVSSSLTEPASGFAFWCNSGSTSPFTAFRVLRCSAKVRVANVNAFAVTVGGYLTTTPPVISNQQGLMELAGSSPHHRYHVLSPSGGGYDTRDFTWDVDISRLVGARQALYSASYAGSGSSDTSGVAASPLDLVFLNLYAMSSNGVELGAVGLYTTLELTYSTLCYQRAAVVS